jgi:serine protease
MRPTKKSVLPALATGGVLAALGITALPMLPVWLGQGETPSVPAAFTRLDPQPNVWSCGLGQIWSGQLPGQIVVDLRDYPSDADVAEVERSFGIDLRPNSIEADQNGVFVAHVPAGVDTSDLLARLETDGRVEDAEPQVLFSIPEMGLGTGAASFSSGSPLANVFAGSELPGDTSDEAYLTVTTPSSAITEGFGASARGNWSYGGAYFTPNDPRYSEQWNFRMIGAEDAWTRSRGKGVTVAVIDTGVSIGPTRKGQACKDFNTTAFTKGYDFVNKDADPYDDHGHGTHVAGTIAESTNNDEGVAGIAFDATIMPLKVLSASGSGTAADIADAIRFAADNGANVINMSLGSRYPSDVIHNACKYARKKGVVIVCAAGNGFGEGVGYPAAFPECIAVSSVGPTGQIAKYSSYGKQVALAAPGGDMIDSGDPADGILQNTNYPESQGGKGDGYYAFQGTSMASPHVAAVAALIEAQGVKDPARVKEILLKSATPNGDSNKYGAGVLSASKATAKAAQTSAVKLRHLLVVGLGCLMFTVGGGRRRSWGLRAAMGGALALGMFGPDWWSSVVGADSAWNLLGFSALLPMAAYVLLRRGPGVKVAGILALGMAVNLYANWHNDTLPFTTATFGDAALPWTFANLGAAVALGWAASWRAFRATNLPRD